MENSSQYIRRMCCCVFFKVQSLTILVVVPVVRINAEIHIYMGELKGGIFTW